MDIFNDTFDVLDARLHPCFVIGHTALPWTGAGVVQSSVTVKYYYFAAFKFSLSQMEMIK